VKEHHPEYIRQAIQHMEKAVETTAFIKNLQEQIVELEAKLDLTIIENKMLVNCCRCESLESRNSDLHCKTQELEAKLARIENVVREMKCSVHIEKDALAVAYLFRALCALVDKERG
jgi:hypothetical protein